MGNLDNFRSFVRPVIFATGVAEAPCSTLGTAFLVKYRDSLYLLTAQHVLRDFPIDGLLIFGSDDSKQPLPLAKYFLVPKHADDDMSDLAIIRVDNDCVSADQNHLLHPLDIASHDEDWFEDRHSAKFFFFGYPAVHNAVEYDPERITTGQSFLLATYVRTSTASLCHELLLDSPNNVEDLNGMSGSPVLSIPAQIEVPYHPRFCGMVLRGNASSGRVHFLDSSRIMDGLEAASVA